MRFIKIVLILLTITILISCTQDNNLEKTYEISYTPKTTQSELYTSSADISSTDGESIESVPLVNSESMCEKLITKEVDIHYMAEKYFINLSASADIYDIENDIGIECFRKNDAGTYYSVHKVEQGGLLYIFYANIQHDENYRPIIEWFYVKKDISQIDFKSIKEGSAIEDVKNIDPTTQVFINIYNSNPNYWNDVMHGFKTIHYLNDGILYFYYEYKDNKLSVYRQEFIEDFTIELYRVTSYYYDGSILPIDRIK